jgi:hypothetical protein
MSGYTLPGTTITEVGQSVTARPSSTQRKPCFIGKASAYKTTTYEETVRSATTNTLVNGSNGGVTVSAAGTQKGLSDIIQGTHFTVASSTGVITWITNTEDIAITENVYGLDLFANLTGFTAFDTAVNGVNATAGYQEFGLNVLGTFESGLALTGGITYNFLINGTPYAITPAAATSITINDVIDLINAQISATYTAALVNTDIRITNNTAGASNDVVITSTGNFLLDALDGWSAVKAAVPGANATYGYQELGLSTAGSTASGLAANTRYYFKVNGSEFTILTASTLTITAILALINTAIPASTTVTATLESGDIRFTYDTAGTSSIVTLAQSSNKEAANGQFTVTLASPGLTHAHYAGKASVTATVGANTYIFGIADDVSVTDTTINLSGTESELNALLVGTVLTIETILPVAVGGTCYITYSYNRPVTDYIYKEFSNFDEVVADLGSDSPSNPLVMIANLALTYYGVPTIAVVQVAPTNQNSDYINALELTRNRDIQTLGILNNSATVRNAAIAHVNDRNLPANKRERMYYAGASALYPLGDNTTANSVCGIAYSIRNEAVIFPNVTRAKYYYKDTATGLDTQTTVDGAFIGAAIAAYRDSFPYPAQTILGHTIPGLELYSEDFDDYFNDDALITAGDASCLLVRIGSSNTMVIVDDLTTDNRSIERNNINIITAKHYVTKDVRIQLDRTFIGNLITNREIYQTNVSTYLTRLLNTYKNMKIIEAVVSVAVTLPTDRRDTVEIFYSFNSVYTHKYFEGTYTIVV